LLFVGFVVSDALGEDRELDTAAHGLHTKYHLNFTLVHTDGSPVAYLNETNTTKLPAGRRSIFKAQTLLFCEFVKSSGKSAYPQLVDPELSTDLFLMNLFSWMAEQLRSKFRYSEFCEENSSFGKDNSAESASEPRNDFDSEDSASSGVAYPEQSAEGSSVAEIVSEFLPVEPSCEHDGHQGCEQVAPCPNEGETCKFFSQKCDCTSWTSSCGGGRTCAGTCGGIFYHWCPFCGTKYALEGSCYYRKIKPDGNGRPICGCAGALESS
ncbi:MAG: hypothetical protein KDD70_19035, partial [Bdellovibrionales bacterium]|nr:hypothetical protein [Bdellovibrionales bacterium]